MKNKFLSVIIALSLAFSCVGTMALAENVFPDVLSPDHDWAAEQINEMTELGIIKGYTDGTFKPDKSITKIEALILFSRVAGFSNEEYSEIVDFAYDKYQYDLEELDLGAYDSFKKELSFLIYKDIITAEELVAYLEDEQYAEDFPRSDAAILLTNLLDAEVGKTDADELDFVDKEEISDSDAGYIAYVVDNGFMNGVQKDDGTIAFDADAPLSRAQVCVLLYRIMTNLEMSVEAGVVFDVVKDGRAIYFENSKGNDKNYIIPETAKVVIDGEEGLAENILEESKIVVVRHGKDIYSIDVISPIINKTVEGIVDAIVTKDNYVRLTIKDEKTGETTSFYGNGDIKVTTDGVADTMKSVKVEDYVVVNLLGADIVSIDRLTAEATVQGTVKSVILDEPISLSVTTVEEVSEEETVSKYPVSEEVTVRRDSKKAALSDVLPGDKVVLTVKRGTITKIVATSVKGSATGSITAIKIASQSTITISSAGTETEYAVALDAEYVVGGSAATIYDLRLGNVVTLTLSGSTVKKLEQTQSASTTTKSGSVESISTAYGYINMTSNDGVNEQIFVSKMGSTFSAKIIDGETGKEIAFKNLKKGDYVIATGAYTNGAFVAKTIVVTPVAP